MVDRQRLRRRLRIILVVGGILVALAYAGPRAVWARQRWTDYRWTAWVEANNATVKAKYARDAARLAERLRQEGRMTWAERLAKEAEEYRQEELRHRRKSEELLRRWW
jgi:hypothetical protein